MTVDVKPQLSEFEAVLNDQQKFMQMAKEGRANDFIRDYVNAKTEALGTFANEIQDQAKATAESAVREWLLEQKDTKRPDARVEVKSTRDAIAKGKGAVYNQKSPGAAIDRSEHKPVDMAEYLQAIWHHVDTLQGSEELRTKAQNWKKIANSFGSVVPADGGFLIPEELRSDLLQLALEGGIVRQRAQVIPMSSLALPIPTVDETSRVSSLFGGIIAYWTEEGAAATESQARFGAVRLEAKKLVIYCEAPNELIADADAFSAFISSNLPRAIAFEEDYAFLRGNGVGQPLGVLNGSGLVTTTRSATTGINFTDVVNVFSRLLPSSYQNAVWLAAPDLLIDLLNLAGPGAGTNPLWLQGGQAIDGPPLTLLGRPLYITEKVPARDATGDLSLVDFSHYLIGDRQVVQASSSPHFKFSSDKTAYKILERVDGRPWVNTALTPRNNSSNTLSPYVTVGPT